MKSEIRNFLKTIGKNQKWLAESIGVSDAQISQYLKGTYGGNVQSLEEKLKSFMANYSVNSDDSTNGVFIKTRNTEAVGYILTKSIQKRSLSAIFGNAGFGKTTSIKNYIENRPEAIYIKANNLFTTKDFLEILCEKLNLKKETRGRGLFNNVVKTLERIDRFIIIDEAEWLKDKTLDMIRNIWEESNTPIILVGTLKLKQNLKGNNGELDYLDSRIRLRLTFERLKDEELQEVCKNFGVSHWRKVKELTNANFRLTTFLLEEAKDLAQMHGKAVDEEVLIAASSMIVR
ncbi:AAA family ATPase [Halarcobacter anaerophilus]|jgi:hypothetical protein|uniref:AAA family ATPase n=1 Tax=Halarcobacter anaerophilus TaxID=877500 RepID=UPI0005C974B0|nr:AAA family ATPase [Halarcobacter anaerophilus]